MRWNAWKVRLVPPAPREPFAARWAIMALAAILVVQVVRLAWVAVTPAGPFGRWAPPDVAIPPPPQRAAMFAAFDPFFRSMPGAASAGALPPAQVSLFGVRIDADPSRSSAILAGADGVQNSYGVGEEVQPGLLLVAVRGDSVVLRQGGREFAVALVGQGPGDPAAASVAGAGAELAPGGAAPAQGVPVLPSIPVPASLGRDVAVAPRTDGTRVTGLIVSPRGSGFAAAGLRAGDVIVQVDGQAISSAADVAMFQALLRPGARINLQVERGGTLVPIALKLQGP